ncbi:MAG: hypothetical protein JO314_11370 [Acidobacteria bacterium]|nr:hypothetical protein [Acidobacteriota bacterium]
MWSSDAKPPYVRDPELQELLDRSDRVFRNISVTLAERKHANDDWSVLCAEVHKLIEDTNKLSLKLRSNLDEARRPGSETSLFLLATDKPTDSE